MCKLCTTARTNNSGSDWTADDIQKMWEVIDKIGKEKYGLNYYEPRLEIITYEHMLDIYASNGLPNLYHHWSFGKRFLQDAENYKSGRSNLAYEVVINTDPCVTYLMENNSMTMQTLVMAHAVCGHGSFFKNNYLSLEHTNPQTILGDLLRGREYILECEKKYGPAKVEAILDACHALSLYAVDKYPKKKKDRKKVIKNMLASRKHKDQSFKVEHEYAKQLRKETTSLAKRSRSLNEENILKFIQKKGPKLKKWERNIIGIVQELWQYLYPQFHTQLMNEGWASFWHYTIMNDLYDMGHIDEAAMIEFMDTHSAVLYQPGVGEPGYSGLNPYALGFAIWQDIRRICENPTEEDREWFPDIAGKDWLETVKFAVENFKDESFVLQYLSPKVMRDFKFFSLHDGGQECVQYEVTAIHDDEGYREIRRNIAKSKEITYKLPDVVVKGVDIEGERELVLEYIPHFKDQLAAAPCTKTLKHIAKLWRFPVHFHCDGALIKVKP